MFVAVPLDGTARVDAEAGLRALAGVDAKLVEPDNLHLTLSFLGKTPKEKVALAVEALREAGVGPGFELKANGYGCFGRGVVWMGFAKSAELAALADRLRDALDARGVKREDGDRPFTAHLTLARPRSPRAAVQAKNALKLLPAPSGIMLVRRITLMSSRLSSRGPSYEILAEAKLPPPVEVREK